MADAVYELDPSADTIIVLKNPGAPFAVWEPDAATKTPESGKVALWIEEHWNLNEAVSPAPSIKKKKGKWWQGPVYDWPAVPEPAPEPEPEPPLEDQFAPVDDASRDEVMDLANDDDQSTIRDINLGSSLFGGEQPQSAEANSFVVRAETEAPSKSGFDEPNMLVDDGTGEQGEGNVYYYVSSRHLALASGFFKSALAKDGWLEGHPSAEDGKYHLSTADWDPEAFLILLRIFHLRNRDVPRSLTLEMLARIAVLVDYYRCSEAVEIFSEIWINAARSACPVPATYGRDLVLWMCIAWVFKLPAEFEQTTKAAIMQSETPTVQNMDLPIPGVVIDAMEHRRYQAIEKLVAGLHGWLRKFRDASYSCPQGSQFNFTCSSVLLGGLTKEMDRAQCWFPRPEVPFHQLSLNGLHSGVYDLEEPKWFPEHSRGYSYSQHSCSFRTTVKYDANGVVERLTGLNLGDFKDRAEG